MTRQPAILLFLCCIFILQAGAQLYPFVIYTPRDGLVGNKVRFINQDSKGKLYFGTTGGQVYASADSGDSWEPIVHDLPAVLSVEVQTLK